MSHTQGRQCRIKGAWFIAIELRREAKCKLDSDVNRVLRLEGYQPSKTDKRELERDYREMEAGALPLFAWLGI